jgi:TonB family protein
LCEKALVINYRRSLFIVKKNMPNKLKIAFWLSFIFTFYTLTFSQEDSKPKSGIGNGDSQKTIQTDEKAIETRILSKPSASYTDAARKNGTEGAVRLRVVFLASGEIGKITAVTVLPDGLTEQAIAAARQIKFTPAMRNGAPRTVVKLVEYSFSTYYRENDKELKQNAEILEMPAPEHPQSNELNKIEGKVNLAITLNSAGSVQILKMFSHLPAEFEQKALEAASKIKFKPAVHKNGNLVTQVKVIEYEFKAQ